MDSAEKSQLVEGAKLFGVELTDKMIEQFSIYMEELEKWNKAINLTSVKGEDTVVRHFIDSMIPLKSIKPGDKVLDIGTGAGFPGLVLKIVEPSLEVTLLDSVEKKTHFIKDVVRKCGLEGVTIEAGRVEDDSTKEKLGRVFDCTVSRAFAVLDDFYKASKDYVKKGGKVIALKGPVTGALMEELEKTSVRYDVTDVEVPGSLRKATLVVRSR
ncbi:MAG: 16S rRNA (guanine(527)-N(7))-methyltransferase RsmG [Deltaproteobacteria bacterium]|nr:16S rRNA (guanine(527)-N(7))-methyltransferase RsmG [Deltaproteobacteria bacterium]